MNTGAQRETALTGKKGGLPVLTLGMEVLDKLVNYTFLTQFFSQMLVSVVDAVKCGV